MSDYIESKRTGFVILDGKVIFQTKENRVSTIQWMQKDLELTDEQIENTIRGGIFINKITICKGKDYRPIDMNELTAKQLMIILDRYVDEHCIVPVHIHNGCVVGEYGEDWEPVQDLGSGIFRINNIVCE